MVDGSCARAVGQDERTVGGLCLVSAVVGGSWIVSMRSVLFDPAVREPMVDDCQRWVGLHGSVGCFHAGWFECEYEN